MPDVLAIASGIAFSTPPRVTNQKACFPFSPTRGSELPVEWECPRASGSHAPCPCHLDRWHGFSSGSSAGPAMKISACYLFNRCARRRHRPIAPVPRRLYPARCEGQHVATRSRSLFCSTSSTRRPLTESCRPLCGLKRCPPILAEAQRLPPASRRTPAEAQCVACDTNQRGSDALSDHEVVFTLALGDRCLEPFRSSPFAGPGNCGVVWVEILRNAF